MSDTLELRVSRYDHPDALAMTDQAQQYYEEIYGGPVSPAVRRLGCGQRLLHALEEDAAARGATRMLLSTGQPQTEAVALYRAAGYVDVEPFGFYAGSATAVHLGKDL